MYIDASWPQRYESQKLINQLKFLHMIAANIALNYHA